jgi:hypothetical protein
MDTISVSKYNAAATTPSPRQRGTEAPHGSQFDKLTVTWLTITYMDCHPELSLP